MTNEEAFEKKFPMPKGILTYHEQQKLIGEWHDCKRGWQAAIAYMQEQSEPVVLEAIYEIIINWDDGGGKRSRRELARRIVSYCTTPQRQQPLKRLGEDRIDEIFNSYSDEQGYVAIDDWHLMTIAIMDAMQELNK